MKIVLLFQERLWEKVHATIPKGIVGDFEFTVFQKKFQRMAREAMDVCLRVLEESNKSRFDSYSVRKSALIISHITFRDCRVHSFSDNLSRNSCIHANFVGTSLALMRVHLYTLHLLLPVIVERSYKMMLSAPTQSTFFSD